MIAVTGLPRSGTSLMMRMLEAGGVPVLHDPESQPPDEWNPHGYYEHPAVMLAAWPQVPVIPDGTAVKVMSGLFEKDVPKLEAVIVMRRPLEQILSSINKRRAQLGRPLETEDYLAGQLDALRLSVTGAYDSHAFTPHIEVWFADLFRQAPYECLRVRNLLGRSLDLAAMAACVDPALRRHG